MPPLLLSSRVPTRAVSLALAFLTATGIAVSQSTPARKATTLPGQPAANAPAAAPAATPASGTQRYDIKKLCDVLVSRGNYTLIPKRAVLFASPERQQSIGSDAGQAQFQQWQKFLASNLSWISTYEVTLEQARGIKPLHPDVMKTIQLRGGLVVAVYQGSPISMATPAPVPNKASDTQKAIIR